MLKNYLLVAIRNMRNNKLFTFINVIGMSVGLACCILIFLFAHTNLNYDQHHDGQVFRIISTINQKDGQLFRLTTSSVPVGPVLKQEISGIEQAARVTGANMFGGKSTIRYENRSWFIEDGFIADSSIFHILKFDIIAGNKAMPLTHPDAIVLEKNWAITLFGGDDPIGKSVKIGTAFGAVEFEVTAVYDKSTDYAQFEPGFFISTNNAQWNDFFNHDMTNWVGNNMVFTYLKLSDTADPEEITKLIHTTFLKYGSEVMKEMGLTKVMTLQPVENTHTETDFMINMPDTVNVKFMYVLISIGVLILILACVNYINLSTARAGKRAMEIGIRKVLGVTPRNIVLQFLSESTLTALFALILGLIIVQAVLPAFNTLVNSHLLFNFETIGSIAGYLLLFLLITGLLSGFYPAMYLASFRPQVVLKGKGVNKPGGKMLRSGLVITQFVITICLISAILIIFQQVNYIKNKELGFDANAKLIIPLSSEESSAKYETLKNKFLTNAAVIQVTGSNSIPGSPIPNDLLVYKDGQTMDDAVHIYSNRVDLNFTQVLGLQLLSGAPFHDYENDSTIDYIYINETASKLLDIKLDDTPGQYVYFNWEGRKNTYEIKGVVNDIHQFSLHRPIDAMMYSLGDGKNYDYMTLDVNMTDMQGLISGLENEWKEQIAETPFEYYPLADHLMRQYEADFNTFDLIKYFTLISIIISCLGLYAMSLYMAEKRIKEIGIRKSFGAGTKEIFSMVSFDLFKLLIIAFLVSLPITWYSMKSWLDTFAYRVSPSVMNFIISGLITVAVGWLTVSFQSMRAAMTNPASVLKEE
jgi:putative ABC transport system permease protein